MVLVDIFKFESIQTIFKKDVYLRNQKKFSFSVIQNTLPTNLHRFTVDNH